LYFIQYPLTDGQKFTVLMHDYEFTVSIPTSTVTTTKYPEPTNTTTKVNNVLDWMDEEPIAPAPKAIKATTAPPAPITTPVNSKPVCKYGATCYRTNPAHFNQFSHPHLTTSATSSSTPSSATPQSVVPSKSGSISKPSEIMTKPVEAVEAKSKLAKESEMKIPISAPTTKSSEHITPQNTESSTHASSSGKRPMPALDLLDDEENYLPKSKKPKLTASIVNKSNDMDWMGEDLETKTAESMDVTPGDSILSQNPKAPSPSPPSQTKESTHGTTSNMPEIEESKEILTKGDSMKRDEEMMKKRPISSATITKSDTEPKSLTSLLSCHLKTWEELETEMKKEGKKDENLTESTCALVIPSIGKGYVVQEAIDVFLELAEKYANECGLGKRLKIWFWPETVTWAAALRRRLAASSSSPSGVALSSLIEMLSPGSNLIDSLPSIKADRVVIVTDSNWRFKGVGAPNSFNVQVNKLYASKIEGENEDNEISKSSSVPSLTLETKSIFNVGKECGAYPISVSSHSILRSGITSKGVLVSHIIQLIPPSIGEETSPSPSLSTPEQVNLLRQSFLSVFGCFTRVNAMK
jgi:hypothetical protein